MVLCIKFHFSPAPAAAIFLSAVIILSCFTDLIPFKSYINFPSASYLSSAPVPPKCDIFRGEWVPDPHSPQYTNETCSYIQANQNCMFYGRPDLEFLKWRWKPDGCDLPRFDPHKFLQIVGNKTLAFVGDSLSRNHYQSLICLLSQVESPKNLAGTGSLYDLNKIMYFEGYNFTIYIFWTPFLVRTEKDADNPGASRLYLDEADDKWLSAVPRFDYVLLSAANWFTTATYFYERGQLVGGQFVALNFTSNLTNRYSHRMAFRTALRALNGIGFRGKVIVRTLTPVSHFEGGPWNDGGDCPRTRPYQANETAQMNDMERDFYTGQVEEFKDAAARGLDVALMDPTAAMLMRPDGHPSRYGHWPNEKLQNDCIHWCLPGPIDAWNDMLLHILSD
ncbi:protein trichome birefringence-like 21 [Phragmites australis]|uniref:protein trichome birefringence-like 21 n=1 Tax=Phragmites australis TaxID=29695 RepID=UPI002D7779A4|nr:protein trichome birefringence-like 21 [Phragmites australis]